MLLWTHSLLAAFLLKPFCVIGKDATIVAGSGVRFLLIGTLKYIAIASHYIRRCDQLKKPPWSDPPSLHPAEPNQ